MSEGVPFVIRTILFDMGNVLMPFSHFRMCAQIAALCGLSTRQVWGLLIDSGLQWQFERGELSVAQFHREWTSACRRHVDREALVHAGSDIFRANPEILPLLSELKARGLRLVLLSNTSAAHFDFVRSRFSVLDAFDAFVTSFEVGALKPDPTMYLAAVGAIRCAPQQCFYTDDIPAYVGEGRSFGLEAEVFVDLPDLRANLKRLEVL